MDDFPWFAPITSFEDAFGEIEESTTTLLSCLPDCTIPLTAPKLPFGTRVDILLEVLPRYPGPEYCELLTCLQQVESLASKRTILAHNAMWFGYQDEVNASLATLKRSRRQRRLSIEEVTELAGNAQILATRVAAATGSILRNFG